VIVILDACHAGGISRGGKGAGKDAALTDRYYEEFTASEGRALIASCAGGEFSWEDEDLGHGVFTGSLVRALSGEADAQPADGLVSLFELRRFLEEDVTTWAKQRGKSQTPQVNLESYRGDIPIALNSEFLGEQARLREERRALAERLKLGLVQVEGLTPTALGEAMKLLGRIAQGRTPSPSEARRIQFMEKLVDGSIDAAMYETALAGIANEDAEIPDSVRRMLETLPDDQREAFRLRTVDGLSEAEIADRLGVSRAEVADMLERARETLRKERGR
jgi:RNA polymerase sigma factor (sigma-70 family)